MRQMLALMASPAVREANTAETALLVLNPDLTAVLWANVAGAATFSLPAPGPQAEPAAGASVLGQISGARRLLGRTGRTQLMLRNIGGARAAAVPAELRLVSPLETETDPAPSFALLATKARRPAYAAGGRDAALLREAGLADAPTARLVAPDAAAETLAGDDLAGADRIARLLARQHDLAEVTAAEQRFLLARVAPDRLLALPLGPAEHQQPQTDEGENVAARQRPAPEETADSPATTAAAAAPGTSSRIVRSNWGSAATGPAPSAATADADEAESLPAEGDGAEAAAPLAEDADRHSDKGPEEDPLPSSLATDAAEPVHEEQVPPETPAEEILPTPPEASASIDAKPARRHSVWGAAPSAPHKTAAPDAGSGEEASSMPPSGAAGDETAAAASAESPSDLGKTSDDAAAVGDDDPAGTEAPRKTAPGDAPAMPDQGEARPPSADGEQLADQEADGRDGDGSDTAGEPGEAGEDQAEPADAAAAEAGSPPPAGTSQPEAPQTRPATAADFHAGGDADEAAPESEFTPRPGGDPVRFVWRVDSEGRFRSLSPEFAAAVGPLSAAVVDRSVDEVARAYGFDADGALRRLLSRRDTWSGRTVMWPLERTSMKVPVDLAALPIYARDRSFDGFRGFGVVRLADAVDDPDALGLDPRMAFERAGVREDTAAADAAEEAGDPMPVFMKSIGAASPPVSFGRRDPDHRPAAQETAPGDEAHRDDGETASGDKIIRLEERRKAPNSSLSQTEEAAFRAIGETLSQSSEPRDLADAVRAASERIEAIEGARLPVSTTGEGGGGAGDGADTPAGRSPEPSGRDAPPSAETTRADDAAGRAAGDPQPPSGAAEDGDAAGGLAAALERVYGSLPLPILVQAGDELVYANRDFLDLAGRTDLDALKDAGGFDGLIMERREGDADFLRLRRANGQTIAIRARMQRSRVAGAHCLVFSFFATPRLSLITSETFERAEAHAPPVSSGVFSDPLLDLAADGVVIVDDAGMITAMSRAAQRLFDIPASDIAGRPFVTLFAHESQKAIKRLLAGEEPTDPRFEADTAGGAGKWFARRDVIGRVAGGGFLPLSVSLGRVPGTAGYCAVVNDITPWKRAEETALKDQAAAEAANLQKSTFLWEVAREIRDPVDAIIGFADLIGTESLGPVGNERYLEYLGDIKRSGRQVIDLATILHDLARVETGRQELTFEAVSLAEVVTEVAAVMAPQANRARVILRTHLPSSVPPVVGDRDTIRQITTNLVANSIRSTPAGGQLIISLRHDEAEGVSLRFRDSGIGMRQDEIDSALRGPGRITGQAGSESGRLGLPLTRALAEANRAEFTIASTPGEGTLVELRFPPARVLLD
ncbi:PAS domain-containing sensor histidine kinase [Jiella sonneratiae]|uniref:histidine kinase n=1 Tax=Jiella sonneratiae TaxID=2816856 RepID=A0ABS3J5M6_9HYPH|nr:PAS domain-containing sensor histidine kinase [Jiella sonneratiae]MBO0904974.1 PAS domain-containing protein [Jiella sonneratiae]